jgi:hypothetical protein
MLEAYQDNIREETNEPLEGTVETMESHKIKDRKMDKDKRVGVCTER